MLTHEFQSASTEQHRDALHLDCLQDWEQYGFAQTKHLTIMRFLQVAGGSGPDVHAAIVSPTKPNGLHQPSHSTLPLTPSQQGPAASKGVTTPGGLATPGNVAAPMRTPGTGGRTPMSVRRTPKQTMGQFLTQQARTPSMRGAEPCFDLHSQMKLFTFPNTSIVDAPQSTEFMAECCTISSSRGVKSTHQ
jgi:hypothetical protein